MKSKEKNWKEDYNKRGDKEWILTKKKVIKKDMRNG